MPFQRRQKPARLDKGDQSSGTTWGRSAKDDRTDTRRRTVADPAQATLEVVIEKAVDLLKRRAHAERELRKKLELRGYPDAHIDATLKHCQERGWLGDIDFARAFADELVRARRYGPRRIVQKLQERGISRDFAERALDEVSEAVDWVERARALIERRSGEATLTLEERARITRFLVGRGFSHRDIAAALAGPA